MTYLLDSCPTQKMLQRRNHKDEKRRTEDDGDDEVAEQVQKEHKFLEDRSNSSRKRCCSSRLDRLREKEQMDIHQHQPFSKLRLNSEAEAEAAGLQVDEGRIIRSVGRKDRHSKVSTSKGPRDRRVRLSAYTAIQFYDVQDRLGYDRPSKAIDWLIDKAKSAIEALSEQPAKTDASLNAVHDSVPHTGHLGKQSIYQQQSLNEIPISKTTFNNIDFSVSGSNQIRDFTPEDDSIQDVGVMDQFQGLIDWNSNAAVVDRDGFLFNSSSAISLQQPLLSRQHHHQLFAQSHRGTLQSSNFLSLPISINGHGQIQSPTSHSISTTGFSSGGGFLGI